MADLPPALPWGVVDTAPAASIETGFTGRSLEELGLAIDDRIEWWGARITRATSEADGHAYDLLYDPFEEFEDEQCTVAFTSEHTLKDSKQDVELPWRKEGDSYDVPDDGDESGAEEEGAAAEEGDEVDVNHALVSLQEVCEVVLQDSREAETLSGTTAEQAEAQFFANLQPHQQIAFASKFRHFVDTFVDVVRSKAQRAADSNVVVTEEDVEDFVQQLGKRPRLV